MISADWTQAKQFKYPTMLHIGGDVDEAIYKITSDCGWLEELKAIVKEQPAGVQELIKAMTIGADQY